MRFLGQWAGVLIVCLVLEGTSGGSGRGVIHYRSAKRKCRQPLSYNFATEPRDPWGCSAVMVLLPASSDRILEGKIVKYVHGVGKNFIPIRQDGFSEKNERVAEHSGLLSSSAMVSGNLRLEVQAWTAGAIPTLGQDGAGAQGFWPVMKAANVQLCNSC